MIQIDLRIFFQLGWGTNHQLVFFFMFYAAVSQKFGDHLLRSSNIDGFRVLNPKLNTVESLSKSDGTSRSDWQ